MKALILFLLVVGGVGYAVADSSVSIVKQAHSSKIEQLANI